MVLKVAVIKVAVSFHGSRGAESPRSASTGVSGFRVLSCYLKPLLLPLQSI